MAFIMLHHISTAILPPLFHKVVNDVLHVCRRVSLFDYSTSQFADEVRVAENPLRQSPVRFDALIHRHFQFD